MLCMFKGMKNAEKFPNLLMLKVDYQEIKKMHFFEKKACSLFIYVFYCSLL